MPIQIITDEKQPIMIGAVEILPFDEPKPSTRAVARDAIKNFKATETGRNRRRNVEAVAQKIKARFGY